jgi:3'(2'), 5'-bisphosphate nucleotidase
MLLKVIQIAVEAGKATLTYYRQQSTAVSFKADQSPLTEADLEADRLILKGLQDLDNSIPCISEERGVPEFAERKSWKRFWLVDPLDGTKEFLKGTGDFTVNIALIENNEPVLGVVYAPVTATAYYAEKGKGSWKQVYGGKPERIYSRVMPSNEGLIVAESRSHPSKELEAILKNIKVLKRIQVGSSLKFCLVAEGAADIYPRLGTTMEWDTAAGDCVYRNSGKEGPRPSPLVYNKPSLKNGNFIIGGEHSNIQAAGSC